MAFSDFSLRFIHTLGAEISTDPFYKCKNGDGERSDESAQGHRARQALGLPTPCPLLPEDAVSFPRALMLPLFRESGVCATCPLGIGPLPQHS